MPHVLLSASRDRLRCQCLHMCTEFMHRDRSTRSVPSYFLLRIVIVVTTSALTSVPAAAAAYGSMGAACGSSMYSTPSYLKLKVQQVEQLNSD
jgi:hypothetical protein